MKEKSEAEVLAEVRHHTTGNRAEIEASKRAECISCLENFPAKQVQDWKDEWTSPEKENRVKRWSAKCPHCGQASVIGDTTGLLSQHYAVLVRDIIERPKSRRP
jgi:Zn finger protein HypA/HybF involved in hydrogenase expression